MDGSFPEFGQLQGCLLTSGSRGSKLFCKGYSFRRLPLVEITPVKTFVTDTVTMWSDSNGTSKGFMLSSSLAYCFASSAANATVRWVCFLEVSAEGSFPSDQNPKESLNVDGDSDTAQT